MSEPAPNQTGGSARMLLLGVFLIGVLLLALVMVLNLRDTLNAPAPTPTFAPTVQGIMPVNPPMPLTDFAFPASRGGTLGLSDLRGAYTLMFFGYTNCPDFCPLTMMEYRRIKERLGEDADAVNFVFVSVDPERDTPERLATYLARYDPAFIGLQGDDDTLERIAGEYGLQFERRYEDAGSTGNYPVDHTTQSYLIDAQGRLRAIFRYGTSVASMADHIQQLMAEDAA